MKANKMRSWKQRYPFKSAILLNSWLFQSLMSILIWKILVIRYCTYFSQIMIFFSWNMALSPSLIKLFHHSPDYSVYDPNMKLARGGIEANVFRYLIYRSPFLPLFGIIISISFSLLNFKFRVKRVCDVCRVVDVMRRV